MFLLPITTVSELNAQSNFNGILQVIYMMILWKQLCISGNVLNKNIFCIKRHFVSEEASYFD